MVYTMLVFTAGYYSYHKKSCCCANALLPLSQTYHDKIDTN